MKDKKTAIDFFSKDIFAVETTGIQIEEVQDDYVICSLEIKNKHLNAAGYVMGGVMFTLADFTFAVAANTKDTYTVSLSSSINFVRATKGPILYAKSCCVNSGKTICFYEITLYDSPERIVSTVTINGFIKKNNSKMPPYLK